MRREGPPVWNQELEVILADIRAKYGTQDRATLPVDPPEDIVARGEDLVERNSIGHREVFRPIRKLWDELTGVKRTGEPGTEAKLTYLGEVGPPESDEENK